MTQLTAIQNEIISNHPELEKTPDRPIESPYMTLPMVEFEPSLSSSSDTQPGPVETIKLWQHFLDKVNPLTKVIHVPSLEPYMMRAAVGMHLVPVEYQALLHSIYTMAVISMSEQECLGLLGYSRDVLVKQYSCNTKETLLKYNHMENYTMVTLQTLLLYLVRKNLTPDTS